MSVTISAVILAYLIGAVPFALIVARLHGIEDLRKVGSGNVGATNVWRVAGKGAAAWVFFGDIGKGVLAVLLALYVTNHFEYALMSRELLLVSCAIAAVLGHVFPVYLGFKGGKGVNTGLGAMITLLPVQVLIALVVFAIVLAVWRYVSLGSVVAAVTLFAVVALQRGFELGSVDTVYFYVTLVLAILIILTHRHNIGRLVRGRENRFSFSSRTGGGGIDV